MEVGDTINYVREIIVKPEYEWRGTRRVRARYEAVKRYEASTAEVVEVRGESARIFGGMVYDDMICATKEDAVKLASERTKGDQEHRDFSSRCR